MLNLIASAKFPLPCKGILRLAFESFGGSTLFHLPPTPQFDFSFQSIFWMLCWIWTWAGRAEIKKPDRWLLNTSGQRVAGITDLSCCTQQGISYWRSRFREKIMSLTLYLLYLKHLLKIQIKMSIFDFFVVVVVGTGVWINIWIKC
jgi:hypothetical protein